VDDQLATDLLDELVDQLVAVMNLLLEDIGVGAGKQRRTS
jgi:hypothetical protein